MESSVYVQRDAAGPMAPAGGWTVLPPRVDDLVALAEALNVPGDLVFIDSSRAVSIDARA
ncbi:hypothetical protein EDD99_8152 [Streptomyces sp. 846.5]|nr:hypothetical protein [Streptomyces sp. 846.5]TDT93342.1 hypothetical protein EDD99_8152 [Streptomyces sp. 846.5]